MIYEQTQHNIVALLHNVGTLEKVQIIRFFSDVMPASRIEPLLDRLVINNYLKYDEATDRYSYPSAPTIKEEILKKRIRAFWVLANWGSESIAQVFTLEYPLQFQVITPESAVFDITVCNTISEAAVAKTVWERNSSKNIPDSTNHIGIVLYPEIGEKLRAYGFDSYCLIDPNSFVTNYFPLG